MEYEFSFVVSGVDVEDSVLVELLQREMDGMLSRAGGIDLLTVSGEDSSAVPLAMRLVERACALIPGLGCLRIDRDVVGVHEITERTGRSRQNVHQWISGARHARHGSAFPTPEGTAGRSPVWLWTEVNAWLTERGLGDGVGHPTREEMTDIDFFLRNLRLLSVRFTPGVDHSPGRDSLLKEIRDGRFAALTRLLLETTGRPRRPARPTVIVADRDEPARAVMEFIGGFDHEVVLVTRAEEFVTLVLSPHSPASTVRPVDSVPVDATVGEWVARMGSQPNSVFATADTRGSGASPSIRRLVGVAA
ncbi:helix-turn-helix transcriptional regulator [Streptomyces alkaliphilus]|uniref:helix-turn-helix transcriptional regulator n=1 Tax=Streptomyces alkaliphilus TaxID=1472722 RepID=UPI00117E5D8E|nr:hypothetical protein [Streptomyces alkaliphilus]MQS09052.1 hypothetical protein [Streptomyces alkaliphilus]